MTKQRQTTSEPTTRNKKGATRISDKLQTTQATCMQQATTNQRCCNNPAQEARLGNANQMVAAHGGRRLG